MAIIREIEAPETIPVTIAQQIFMIGSGIAGGLAGFVLARELSDVREVRTPTVVITTAISALFTIGAGILLARKAKEI